MKFPHINHLRVFYHVLPHHVDRVFRYPCKDAHLFSHTYARTHIYIHIHTRQPLSWEQKILRTPSMYFTPERTRRYTRRRRPVAHLPRLFNMYVWFWSKRIYTIPDLLKSDEIDERIWNRKIQVAKRTVTVAFAYIALLHRMLFNHRSTSFRCLSYTNASHHLFNDYRFGYGFRNLFPRKKQQLRRKT